MYIAFRIVEDGERSIEFRGGDDGEVEGVDGGSVGLDEPKRSRLS